MARKLLYQPWTENDTARTVELLREGKKFQQIARHLKRSPGTVRIYIKRLGLSAEANGTKEAVT